MSNDPLSLIHAVRPDEIERRSLSIIDDEVPQPRPYAGIAWEIVRRMIHTTADFDLLQLVRFQADAIVSGLNALKAGAAIVTDTRMAQMGIPLRRMAPLGCSVQCLMNDPAVAARAKAQGTTRALAAVDAIVEQDQDMDGAPSRIWVIGNAPTALLRLLEHVQNGRTLPALVVGMPVGFVNAAESKELLMRQGGLPSISIQGRKGGSALAACVVNALADVVLREQGAPCHTGHPEARTGKD
ncbi:precorrin-8X methylmutase [Paucidesulfovibrio gracilis DSM 16080]|uniref:Precorrin-8X methylmutase n=1 Tax=Paucidesulfovibrio gracilis DSM 16080 TaxID=1121449 RepID=A0A1T4WJP5_9BACT|nr:precorrin-8X methylmutase [Paucidesulfovibrio gracilis]SKA77128.1 precorrin-8X methylmutase [Paucidesulfovibrio gracilis DSM 16080]